MKVYIAYKYTNVGNKEEIRAVLDVIATILTKNGHDTFVLGRDVKHWKHVNFLKLFPILVNRLSKQDMLMAYIDSDARSSGLLFELLAARCMGKPAVVISKNTNGGIYAMLASKKVTIQHFEDLENTISVIMKEYV